MFDWQKFSYFWESKISSPTIKLEDAFTEIAILLTDVEFPLIYSKSVQSISR